MFITVKQELAPVVFHQQEQKDMIGKMKKNTAYSIFGIVIVIFISGCAQQQVEEKISKFFQFGLYRLS